ncbi:MAG TPA: hypothetical protein VJW23_07895 [Propionibacteriaceae bacterium]|nr:hypothetical protein [Propionibacteriaceae bacterium]
MVAQERQTQIAHPRFGGDREFELPCDCAGRYEVLFIAERFGVSVTTAQRWVNPDYAERDRQVCREYKDRNREAIRAQNRAYKWEQRVSCPQCGNKMLPESTLCEGCRDDEVDHRARQIETWWAEGLTQREIADRLGWTVAHVGVEINILREKGYDLPYRRSTFPKGKPRFPELVVA